MNEVRPLAPSVLEQIEPVPNGVIAVINQLIKRNWNGTSSIIPVNEALGVIYLMTNISDEVVKRNNWIEGIQKMFSEAGYIVNKFEDSNKQYLEFKTA